ncbi:MAG: FGGY family carbohydrate kinase, partial [Alphaproteobacteria bacterium]
MTDAAAVLDLGKTNLKLIVVDAAGRILDTVMADNTPVAGPPYRHVDEAHVWDWLLGALATAAARHAIKAIVPCTYGSTGALVGADGLVLPIMDYEDDPPDDIKAAYAEVAPPFAEVYAPTNPGGLTLGRQLFWQSRAFAGAFARARHILPHAQYWAWRLTGVAAVEVTSLGAQTHLWNPRARAYSSLVAGQGWKRLFPPLRRAWDVLGPVMPGVAAATGLPADTPVLCGIHDSNANYLRYLAAGMTDFTLMSTGTWVISFNAAHPLDALHQDRDTVSNTDVHGNPVACSRFMGGREFDILAGDAPRDAATLDDVAGLIADGTMALPSFTDSGGPFPG